MFYKFLWTLTFFRALAIGMYLVCGALYAQEEYREPLAHALAKLRPATGRSIRSLYLHNRGDLIDVLQGRPGDYRVMNTKTGNVTFEQMANTAQTFSENEKVLCQQLVKLANMGQLLGEEDYEFSNILTLTTFADRPVQNIQTSKGFEVICQSRSRPDNGFILAANVSYTLNQLIDDKTKCITTLTNGKMSYRSIVCIDAMHRRMTLGMFRR